MIPLTLRLQNFLSYADSQEIDFASHHLICLSGKNGHGKSALLDAITWALWGQARKISGVVKADQGLLRLGQSHMMVSLDFALGDQCYRVRREFSNEYGKQHASLEFGIFDPNTQQVTALTDKTVRTTQDVINNTLKLDFDAFVNSAFLRQGNANEFSKKSPKERKDILASILGLVTYDTIRRLALEKIKTAQNQRQSMLLLQDKLKQESARLPEIEQQIALINSEIALLDEAQKSNLSEQHAYEIKRQHIEAERSKRDQLEFQQNQLANDVCVKQQELRTLFDEWRTCNALRSSLSAENELKKQKETISNALHHCQNRLAQSLENKQRLLDIKTSLMQLEQKITQDLASAIHTAEKEKAHLQAQITHAASLAASYAQQKAGLLNELSQLSQEIEKLTIQATTASATNEYNRIEKQFEKRRAYYQQWVARGNMLAAELASLEQKNRLVHDENDPSCPLCEQNLSATRRRFLKQKFEHSEDLLRHQMARMKRLLELLKKLLFEQHGIISVHKRTQEDWLAAHIRMQELARTRDKIKNDIASLDTQHQATIELTQKNTGALDICNVQLTHFAQQQREAIVQHPDYVRLQQEASQIELSLRDATLLIHEADQLRAKQKELDERLASLTQLQEKMHAQETRAHTIGQLCAWLKQARIKLLSYEQQLQPFATLTNGEHALQQELHKLTSALQDIVSRKEKALEKRGSLINAAHTIKNALDELTVQQKLMSDIDQDMHDYQAIAQATGKDGLQALLIEEAIPEIEQEANELLGRLTNNQAQLFIESLRDLKKGGTKETLDIKISDATGTRPYEMFSGGEAFRIDFALRIAISKLLARRAGTALRTLIIDEGFGSQDEDGLSYIMDAIYKIQDDFAKVIIVSHLASMKDQFPVHFVVEKGPSGSKVHIIEQG